VQHDPGYITLRFEVAGLEKQEANRRLANYRQKWRRKTLKEYQVSWMRKRRDWIVLTRGTEQPNDPGQTDVVQSLWRLIPERRRLAEVMSADESLPSEAIWSALKDAYVLCSRVHSVLYLPGVQPRDGACPQEQCRLDMTKYASFSLLRLVVYSATD
jgi:hypothetical protein